MISKDKLDELAKQLKDLRASSKEDYLGRVDYALNMSEQKELTINKPTLTGLRNALQNVEGTQYAKDYPELVKKIKSKLTIDLKKSKQKSKVYEFIGKLAGNKLLEIPHNFANTQLDYDKLLSYIDDVKALKIRHPSNKDIANNKGLTDKQAQPTTKQVETDTAKADGAVETTIINDLYKATNLKGLIEFMSTLPKTYSYQLMITNGEYSDFGALIWAHDLVVALGIDTKTPPFVKQFYNDTLERTISMEVRIANGLITLALSRLAKAQEGLGGIGDYRDIPNVLNPNKHDVVMIPHSVGLVDMIDGFFDSRDPRNLYVFARRDSFGSNKAIKEAGLFTITIDNDDSIQTELPIDFGDKDKKTNIKKVTTLKSITLDVVLALDKYMQDHPGYDSDHDYIKLTDLAKYVKRFDDSKLQKGELRPEYRQELWAGLTFASLISANYVVGKGKKGEKIWRRVYIVDRIKEFKTYGKSNTITAVKVDFTREYKNSKQYNIGVILDGILDIDGAGSTSLKNIGAYILQRFAQHQDKTIKGLPQTIKADKLMEQGGIIDSNRTNQLATLQKKLDQLEERGIIAKWECKNGAHKIRGCDRESQTIIVYPTENIQHSYITKGQSRALKISKKLENKNRIKALKKFINGYTSLKVCASDLDITEPELSEYLAGTKPIPDELMDKLND